MSKKFIKKDESGKVVQHISFAKGADIPNEYFQSPYEQVENFPDIVKSYVDLRLEKYDRLSDQMDIMFKEFKHRRDNGEVLSPEAEAWVNKCSSIKDEFPKEV
ncbi:MAG TPA: hypothetical protein DCL21_01475 [Alphaproteobacteria bacterium]|nr:hypothetical protein [Alphaproteobacteria bacterium]